MARDRLEMVLMSAAGRSPPRIAEHLGRHPHPVRSALNGFAAWGAEAFRPDAPAPDPNYARRARVTGRLTDLLGRDRTWTRRRLAEALGPALGIGHRQTRRHLAVWKAGYRRTARTVGRTQNPETVRQAERVLAPVGKKRRRAG